MQQVKTVNELKSSIEKKIFYLLYILWLFVALIIIYQIDIANKKYQINEQKLQNIFQNYFSQFSEKLSIIATSKNFIDFLRADPITQKTYTPKVLSDMSSLKQFGVIGIEINNAKHNPILFNGRKSNNQISLSLCYSNSFLDPSVGNCHSQLKLYISTEHAIEKLQSIDHLIRFCEHCKLSNPLKKEYFREFIVEPTTHFELPIEIQLDTDWIFYAVCFFMVFIMMSFGIWYRRNISSLFSMHIKEPLELLANSLKNGTNLSEQKDSFIEEVQYLQNQINLWQEQQENSRQQEKTLALGKLAAQVAHDIRSPLVVLDILVKDMPNLSEQHRNLIRHSISRIHGIADDLIITYKSDGKKSYKELKVNIAIALQIESIVLEKRVQYQKKNLFFNLHAENFYHYFCSVETTEFKRMISNLINNTVEADATNIDISLKKAMNFLIISIADNGRGIPKDALKKLNNLASQPIENSSSGLGLSHAFSSVQAWGGKINIESQVGIGTTIEIRLPIVAPPEWFVEKIDLSSKPHVVIVDDEMFIHELWNQRFKSLVEQKQISVTHFYSLASFSEFLQQKTNKEFLFLVDLEFSQEQKLGWEFIAEHHLQMQARLVTNKFDDPGIIAQCERSNIKIIPKHFVPHIPITVTTKVEELA